MRHFFTVHEPTQPTTKDLTTLEDVKAELGTPDSEDEQIELQITRISTGFGEYCDRLFSLEDVTEIFVFDYCERLAPRQPLLLRQYPIVAIESVTVDGVELLSDSYEYDVASGRLWLVSGFWSGRVEVNYSGGYDLPDDAPSTLQGAVIEAIRNRRSFSSADPTIRSTTHGDTSVTYNSEPAQGSGGFSRTITDALQRFVRPSV